MLQFVLTFYFLLIFSLNLVHGLLGNQCNVHDLRDKQCDVFEICDENTNTCRCLEGYHANDGLCGRDLNLSEVNTLMATLNNSNEQRSGGSAVTGFVVPFFILISLVCGVYLSRKYNLMNWARNKILSIRRTNYDEFMIGQDVDDDPPLR